MRTALAVLLAVASLVAAAPARADFSYPDQHPAPAVVAVLANGPALSFWADRHVIGCARITVWQSGMVGRDVWATGGWCTVWLSDDLVAWVTGDDGISEDKLVDACQAVTHEDGHALGLPHSTSGVMAGPGFKPAVKHGWAPWFCWRWARKRYTSVMRSEGILYAASPRLRPVSAP